ncbi:pyridoxamine 5'-phosphate oxidase family protein [Microbacterium sp.]|uniref:pyridoxamine 5'-phosphate oxidase family protein n=1 Tax=Microbacterium sp. TaxID=51671 RepID=UPI003458547E
MTTALTADGLRVVTDDHLATLSTLAPSGLFHVIAVGFTLADGLVRIITMDGSQKVRNIERDSRPDRRTAVAERRGACDGVAGSRRSRARGGTLRGAIPTATAQPTSSRDRAAAREDHGFCGTRRPVALSPENSYGTRSPPRCGRDRCRAGRTSGGDHARTRRTRRSRSGSCRRCRRTATH